MSDTSVRPHGLRVPNIAVPILATCGILAAGAVVLADLADRKQQAPRFAESDFSQVAFVSRVDVPASDGLRAALDEACAATGCDAAILHSVILASAPQMTAAEREAERATRARLRREGLHLYETSPPGSTEARLAQMEIRTADRLDAVHELEHELAGRNN